MDQSVIRPEIQKLIGIFQKTTPENLYKDIEGARINVSHIMSHISSFYEKIRNAIDYNEEHLLRKNAIQRILKRKIRVSMNRKNIGKTLIFELIRAGYLPNDAVPEIKIAEVDKAVHKYLSLLDYISKERGTTDKLKYFDWVMGMAAIEVEERLHLLKRNDALVTTMYQMLHKKIVFENDDGYDQTERNLFLYIAVHRGLIKSDNSIISYYLLNMYYPEFREGDQSVIHTVSADINILYENIQYYLRSSMSFKLAKFLQPHTVYFTILRDVIEEDVGTAYSKMLNGKAFDDGVRVAASKRYQLTSRKLARSIVNSVIYIFVTKIVLAFVLELPYELFVLEEFRIMPLAINVLFPPSLMFVIASSAKIPSSENTKAIVAGIKAHIYPGEHDVNNYKFKPVQKRTFSKTFSFTFIYAAIFITSFGAIVYGLRVLQFNIISILLFLLFLSVVSFLGMKIRGSVKSLNVLKGREGFISSFFDFLFLPILKVGQWISVKFSKFNVFAIFLDLVIEAPFKTIIALFEEWFSFMKEKREEIY